MVICVFMPKGRLSETLGSQARFKGLSPAIKPEGTLAFSFVSLGLAAEGQSLSLKASGKHLPQVQPEPAFGDDRDSKPPFHGASEKLQTQLLEISWTSAAYSSKSGEN